MRNSKYILKCLIFAILSYSILIYHLLIYFIFIKNINYFNQVP